MNWTFNSIGHVESPFKDRFGTPRQGFVVPSSLARVHLRPDLQPEELLCGLEGFSHVWLISVFHQNTNKKVRPKIHPPRLAGEKVGLFASRSPHRPNPVGLTLARVEAVHDRTLWLSGVDLIDGTPLIDIKPYMPEADQAPDARIGWVDSQPWGLLTVKFRQTFFAALNSLWQNEPLPMSRDRFVNLIRECLQVDPRPTVYKESPRVASDRSYWLRLYDFDVEFSYEPHSVIVHCIRWGMKNSTANESVSPAGPTQSAVDMPY